MDYIPLPDNTAPQIIVSTAMFDELRRVQAQAPPYSGGMYWKREGERQSPRQDYLRRFPGCIPSKEGTREGALQVVPSQVGTQEGVPHARGESSRDGRDNLSDGQHVASSNMTKTK